MFATRDLVLVSLFSGVFFAYGYISGVSLPQQITHSFDIFFLIAALFTILALEIRQSWSATLMGVITGVILLGDPRAVAPWHITLGLVANGLTFDLCLRFMSRKRMPPSSRQMVIAATLGNLVMAPVGLFALTPTVTIPVIWWPIYILANGLVGVAGARFGIAVIRRLRASTRNLGQTISMETSTIQPGQVRQ